MTNKKKRVVDNIHSLSKRGKLNRPDKINDQRQGPTLIEYPLYSLL